MPPKSRSKFSPTTKLYINVSILSIALNATFFSYLIHSDKLYDVGKCWSSYVVMLLPGMELLKHQYVRKVLQLEGVSNVTNSQQSTKAAGGKYQSKRVSPLKEVGGFAFLMVLSVLFYGFICLILGAPLDQHEETTALAVTLTVLTIFPIVLFIGHSETMQLLFSETFELRTPISNSYLTLLKNNCVGVILGAWGASVVAPLDWDRPWQVYPLPNVVGAVGGAFGMNVFTLLSATYFALCKSDRKKSIV
ncbi:uncharacterized protein LOC129723045 [Wyeomyia smithii]|uniref:uncharacterized protein LOC129723045 n=1 Tax=Wyeomyia smithii TaxID=174621 RepID=UPI002467F742|nr:uncharacterized protein LOC129723045 [Wyeomyia smithii]